MKNVLYEILVPTRFGDNHAKPIRTAHHKQWDKYIQSITGGLTIYGVGKGKWLHKGVEYPERVIPVRVMCVEKMTSPTIPNWQMPAKFEKGQIEQIIKFTLSHYRQKAVMYYVVSDDVKIAYSNEI